VAVLQVVGICQRTRSSHSRTINGKLAGVSNQRRFSARVGRRVTKGHCTNCLGGARMSDFYKYFKENMDSLGLPAPESLFGNLQSAVGTITVIVGLIDKFGHKVTVKELIYAGTKLEKLGVIAACSAAFYAGAVIGSLAVATGRCLGRGASLGDTLVEAARWGFKRPWLAHALERLPGVHNPNGSLPTDFKRHGAIR